MQHLENLKALHASTAAKRPRAWSSFFHCTAFALTQALIVLLLAFQSLRLWDYDLRVPLNYAGDSIVILVYIKGLIQDGWPNVITHLSAPFSYPAAAFPILTSSDWLLIKGLSLFTSEPGYLLNVFWLLSLVLTAWAASFSAYLLGLSKALSFATGVLYALLPYAFLRNVAHLNLVYYAVPPICLLAVIIATRGAGVRHTRIATGAGLAACVLQGFDYIYYSFFSVIIFAIAALLSYQHGNLRRLLLPFLAIAIVTASTFVNLLPALQSWHREGKPAEMAYKSPAEAEIYGLKIRRLLSPHPDNPIGFLAKYAQKDRAANFPNENENTHARLGIYGALGFLLTVLLVLRQPSGKILPQPLGAIAVLGIATTLFITVGGFGAMFNVITVPDIRAYNRFSVFLAFFAIMTLGLWLTQRLRDLSRNRQRVAWVATGIVILLSLQDQMLDSRPLIHLQPASARLAHEEQRIVMRLERMFPAGTAVLELPFAGFPIDYRFNRMHSYDHGRPYLWSRHLKWSWPSFSRRHSAWQKRLALLQGRAFVRAAILSGFEVIWIDRYAYEDDGTVLLSSLMIDGVSLVDTGSRRIAVLDLRTAAAAMRASMGSTEFKRESNAILEAGATFAEWGKGFYAEEVSANGKSFRWAKKRAVLAVINTANHPTRRCLSFEIAALGAGSVAVEGAGAGVAVPVSTEPQRVLVPINVGAAQRIEFHFNADLPRISVPQDPRDMFFYISDFSLLLSSSPEGGQVSCDTRARN